MTAEQRREFLWSNFAGPTNRFRRQELMQEITGEKVHLVKCGISHLLEAIATADRDSMDKALAAAKPAKAKETEATTGEPTPGAHVIRKKCGRKGIIRANVNGKLEIELEDGSIRKPAATRFSGLYKFQNA